MPNPEWRSRLLLIVLFIALSGCAALFPDYRPVVFHHPNGQRAAEGHFTSHPSIGYLIAEVEKRDLPPWKKHYRVGKWRYWHPNGVLRAEVRYATESYVECCVAGPCPGTYERIVGKPKVFDETGAPVDLKRASKWGSMKTNCGATRVHRPAYLLPFDLAPEWNPHDSSLP